MSVTLAAFAETERSHQTDSEIEPLPTRGGEDDATDPRHQEAPRALPAASRSQDTGWQAAALLTRLVCNGLSTIADRW
jgi:hypothetical protein